MTRSRARRVGGGTAALLSLGLVACASDVPPPTAQLGAASQAILNAERAGAPQFAPGELQMARNKLAAADDAMRRDDRTEARRLAEQAQMDADLAAVHAQNAAAQQAAAAVRRDQQVLSGSTGVPYTAPGYSGTATDGRAGVPLTPGPTSWDTRVLEPPPAPPSAPPATSGTSSTTIIQQRGTTW
ncbi:MAG TPA: DUF4398 domain-containing protein [Azospirillum sp.]